MNLRRSLTIGLVLIGVLLVGITIVNPSLLDDLIDGDNDGAATNDGGAPSTVGQIDLEAWDNSSSSSEFEMTVEARVHVKGQPDIRLENPVVCLYNKSGKLLYSHDLPSIISDENGGYYNETKFIAPVSQWPKYIFVDHPDLRHEQANLYSEVRKFDGGNSYSRLDGGIQAIPNEFEFPRTNQTGKCG